MIDDWFMDALRRDIKRKGFFCVDNNTFMRMNQNDKEKVIQIIKSGSYELGEYECSVCKADEDNLNQNQRHRHKQHKTVFFIYDEERYVRPKWIERVSDLVDFTLYYRYKKLNRYFRGQKAQYDLMPSLFRHQEWVEREMELNARVYSERPQDFADCSSTFEKLVRLKHYVQPSRLIDLSANPLVALFFACSISSYEEKEDVGVIYEAYCENENEKFACASDTVLMLTAMTNTPLRRGRSEKWEKLTLPCKGNYKIVGKNCENICPKIDKKSCYHNCWPKAKEDGGAVAVGNKKYKWSEMKERQLKENRWAYRYIGELSHQCKKEGMTIYWDDLCYNELNQCVLVRPPLNNDRIVRQQGCFIMCGMNPDNIYEPPEDLYRFFRHPRKGKKATFYYILPEDRELILKKLKLLGIDEYYIYPEMEREIEVLKNSVLKKTNKKEEDEAEEEEKDYLAEALYSESKKSEVSK